MYKSSQIVTENTFDVRLVFGQFLEAPLLGPKFFINIDDVVSNGADVKSTIDPHQAELDTSMEVCGSGTLFVENPGLLSPRMGDVQDQYGGRRQRGLSEHCESSEHSERSEHGAAA